jgi:hypothetical protein
MSVTPGGAFAHALRLYCRTAPKKPRRALPAH